MTDNILSFVMYIVSVIIRLSNGSLCYILAWEYNRQQAINIMYNSVNYSSLVSLMEPSILIML